MQFYSVKHKKAVTVPDDKVQKKSYTRKTKTGKTMTSYAVKAVATVDGEEVKLTKFVSKDVYDKLS